VDDDRLPQPVRGIFARAVTEAQRRAASAVGPEHLLLALTLQEGSPAAALLAEYGLDHDGLDRALDEEQARSLAVVGIADLDPALLVATRIAGRPAWASGTREVLRRAQQGGRGRRRGSMELDVLVGVVTANVGTVPRALVYADIDRDALIGRVTRERWAEDDDRRGGHQGVSAQDRTAARREAVHRAQAAARTASRDAQRAAREASDAAERRSSAAMQELRDRHRENDADSD
jgi:ATP-dependent Clp protease ATP-binding subunit ClpA